MSSVFGGGVSSFGNVGRGGLLVMRGTFETVEEEELETVGETVITVEVLLIEEFEEETSVDDVKSNVGGSPDPE